MSELTINIEQVNPIDFFGVNNSKLNVLKKKFPLLKVVSRGTKLKAAGSEEELADQGETGVAGQVGVAPAGAAAVGADAGVLGGQNGGQVL